ncbi:tRNA(His) guanylyltransferase Thg1 family protein [Streptomyces synnematoformans]|uniref:tRNA(His) guanylyltransferase Thg1 family protein n=2 Tax=Streptomyces synnematoformans TaxID=415721 RepID=A0ABP5IX10_9ACTN
MKAYEAPYRHLLPRRTYAILRIDGRAFHQYLRGADRPFDMRFMADMDKVAEALCAEISGAKLAYTQSDEISVLVTDFGTTNTQAWFGGVAAKWLSISAALATQVLNDRRPGRRALFDARVFTIGDPVEVANYLLWRQRDAVRNSISMAAQSCFSPRRLHGVSSDGMQELLRAERGINWNDYPAGCKRGRITTRKVGPRETTYTDKRTSSLNTVTAMRSWWETEPAPHFTTEPGDWLARTIPPLPTLTPEASR